MRLHVQRSRNLCLTSFFQKTPSPRFRLQTLFVCCPSDRKFHRFRAEWSLCLVKAKIHQSVGLLWCSLDFRHSAQVLPYNRRKLLRPKRFRVKFSLTERRPGRTRMGGWIFLPFISIILIARFWYTFPPAAIILLFSSGSDGLWS